MVETLLGGLLGGIFRVIPEIMKFFDAKNERKHELEMQDKALAFQTLTGNQRVAEIEAKGQEDWNISALDTLKAAIESQKVDFKPTGNVVIDFIMAFLVFVNSSVRPVITYWFFMLYAAAKIAVFMSAIKAGMVWSDAVKLVWTEADMALFAGILNFWFLGRVFDKVK